MARFYVGVLGARVLAEDEHHAALDVRGFRLVVHQIPAHLAKDIEIRDPPSRRESETTRLDYPSDDLVRARRAAEQLGGRIDAASPSWAGKDSRFFLGVDPEGNVFGISDGSAS